MVITCYRASAFSDVSWSSEAKVGETEARLLRQAKGFEGLQGQEEGERQRAGERQGERETERERKGRQGQR